MNVRHIGVAILLAISLATGGLSVIKPPSGPAPAPTPQPATGLLDGVSRADAANLRAFYEAMADIVVRDGSTSKPVSNSTGDLRNRHENALRMAFAATGMVGKYPGLGEKLDAHLLEAIGSTDLPLDAALRDKAARAFLSVK
jgi:hypothetical protein